MYSCYLLVISSASLGLSHSIVFLYFFAMITEEGFLISPCYSLELCIQMGVYLSFSPLPFASLLFSAICKACSSILRSCISFSWGWSWSLPPVWCHEPPTIVVQALCLSDLTRWVCLSVPRHNHKRFDYVMLCNETVRNQALGIGFSFYLLALWTWANHLISLILFAHLSNAD